MTSFPAVRKGLRLVQWCFHLLKMENRAKKGWKCLSDRGNIETWEIMRYARQSNPKQEQVDNNDFNYFMRENCEKADWTQMLKLGFLQGWSPDKHSSLPLIINTLWGKQLNSFKWLPQSTWGFEAWSFGLLLMPIFRRKSACWSSCQLTRFLLLGC